jgi:hypothetical protein
VTRRTLLLLVVGAAGCGTFGAKTEVRPDRLPGRVLVVARAADASGAAIAEDAADIFAEALRYRIDALGRRRLQVEAHVAGALAVPAMLSRVALGGWPSADEGRALHERFGITAVAAVEVTAWEQVWGKHAKFTRVGVRLDAVDAVTGARIVARHRDAEVEDKRGRAFRYALEQVVTDLAADVGVGPRLDLVEAWRFWRR